MSDAAASIGSGESIYYRAVRHTEHWLCAYPGKDATSRRVSELNHLIVGAYCCACSAQVQERQQMFLAIDLDEVGRMSTIYDARTTLDRRHSLAFERIAGLGPEHGSTPAVCFSFDFHI